MIELTQKQSNILSYIKNYCYKNKLMPSVRDVGKHFEITGKGSYDHMKALEKKGFIKIIGIRSRGIILPKNDCCPYCHGKVDLNV